MGIYFGLSSLARLGAIVCYFAPTLGLFDLRMHKKMAAMNMNGATERKIYDVFATGGGYVEITYVRDIFKAYHDEPKEEFLLHFIAFAILSLAHVILASVVVRFAALPTSHSYLRLFVHAASQYLSPTVLTDWD